MATETVDQSNNSHINYADYRDGMQDGDILLFKGQGLISSIIKWKTKSAYSHAGIVVWWNKRLMVLEAVGKGVVARPISYNLKKYHGAIDYYQSKNQIAPETRSAMVKFAQDQLGKEYNTLQLIVFFLKLLCGFKLDSHDERGTANQYFCSQYVADIYASNGHDLAINFSNEYTSPDMLERSEALKFVGTLKHA